MAEGAEDYYSGEGEAPLGLKSAPGREPVPGFDLTFSSPKSVSLAWALGDHPVSGQVMESHRAAVAEALGYLERAACWARRGKGGAEFVPGAGFLAAGYAHRSSRAGFSRSKSRRGSARRSARCRLR
jgi:conjugative relaxase-like TrwC/TraI family protein